MKTIVVTGTHAVGKTVLCERLVQTLAPVIDVKLIPEVARILIAKGIEMNDKVSEFGIVNYILTYLTYCRKTTAQLVVSDRSIFDLFAYISVRRPSEVRDEFFRLAEEHVYREIEQVDTFVYIPIEFDLHVDGVRPVDKEYQELVDKKIQSLLRALDARVITVSGTVDERVDAVRRSLNV